MYIDLGLLVVWGLVTWCVAGEGAFGAAINCLCIILAGLLAMNFFEPFANIGQQYIASGWAYYWDLIALAGLFAGFLTGLRFLADYYSPRLPRLIGLAEDVGRWSFGAIAGYVTMAFLLTALHTAPLPREFAGFKPERKNLFNIIAPDRQWLGFTQFASEAVFAKGYANIFDGPVVDFIQTPADVPKNTIWPSFPIRYATRREQYSGGAFALAAPAPIAPPTTSQPSQRPSPGAGAAGF